MTLSRTAVGPSDAVRYCEEVTRTRARNFWYGIRLLPVRKRQALAAVYAMSRRIDDVGDGDFPAEEQLAALGRIEESLRQVHPNSDDPVLSALGQAAALFPLPIAAFGELIDGVRMDVAGTQYATFQDLVPYCRRVAGAVGRLSLGIFGSDHMEQAQPLADDLGVAMQLTNILRDVREDLARGRVYIPAEDLERFGCTQADLENPSSNQTVGLLRFEAERARGWFARGTQLLPLLDRRSAACAGAMAGIYSRLLRRIEARPEEALARRISLSPGQKAWVAARALIGAAG
jgi:phytoene synthase